MFVIVRMFLIVHYVCLGTRSVMTAFRSFLLYCSVLPKMFSVDNYMQKIKFLSKFVDHISFNSVI